MICQRPGVLQDYDNHDNDGDGDGNDPNEDGDGDGDDNDEDDPDTMSTQHDPPRTWCVPQQSDSTPLEALQLFEEEPCRNIIGNNDNHNNEYGNNDNHNDLQLFKGKPCSL